MNPYDPAVSLDTALNPTSAKEIPKLKFWGMGTQGRVKKQNTKRMEQVETCLCFLNVSMHSQQQVQVWAELS